MKFREIAGRLNGVSTPIFGVQWTPPTSDVQVARGVIEFLGDRRLLYAPEEAEVPEWCFQSAIQIREFMTGYLVRGGLADELAGNLRGIRAAARDFLVANGQGPGDEEFLVMTRPGGMALHDWRFNQSIGALRATVGVHVAQLAVKYGIDVDEPLASILPPAD